MEQRIGNFLEYVGVEATDQNVQHTLAFAQALRIYEERQETHGNLWHATPIETLAALASSKAARAKSSAERWHGNWTAEQSKALNDTALDDALDLVNYGLFIARLINDRIAMS